MYKAVVTHINKNGIKVDTIDVRRYKDLVQTLSDHGIACARYITLTVLDRNGDTVYVHYGTQQIDLVYKGYTQTVKDYCKEVKDVELGK